MSLLPLSSYGNYRSVARPEIRKSPLLSNRGIPPYYWHGLVGQCTVLVMSAYGLLYQITDGQLFQICKKPRINMAMFISPMIISSVSCFPIVISETINATQSEVQRANAPVDVVQHSPWPDFDKVVEELREWLTLLERMLQTQSVTVGDLEEMEDMLAKQKVGGHLGDSFSSDKE